MFFSFYSTQTTLSYGSLSKTAMMWSFESGGKSGISPNPVTGGPFTSINSVLENTQAWAFQHVGNQPLNWCKDVFAKQFHSKNINTYPIKGNDKIYHDAVHFKPQLHWQFVKLSSFRELISHFWSIGCKIRNTNEFT